METTGALGPSQSKESVRFAHDSEREFAAILDYYQIRWEYEPRAFPLRWDAAGNAIESFTPDFYLVDQDLFVELTTLKQKLVTKKNRKLRLLRALYPDVRIKLFYGRDFRSLMAKYGLGQNPDGETGGHGDAATRGREEVAVSPHRRVAPSGGRQA